MGGTAGSPIYHNKCIAKLFALYLFSFQSPLILVALVK